MSTQITEAEALQAEQDESLMVSFLPLVETRLRDLAPDVHTAPRPAPGPTAASRDFDAQPGHQRRAGACSLARRRGLTLS